MYKVLTGTSNPSMPYNDIAIDVQMFMYKVQSSLCRSIYKCMALMYPKLPILI